MLAGIRNPSLYAVVSAVGRNALQKQGATILGLKLAWMSQYCTDAQLWIDGVPVPSSSPTWVDVKNPCTQEVVTRVPEVLPAEFARAVSSASRAFPGWADTPVVQRQRIMSKLASRIYDNTDELATSIVTEQGKTWKDAQGDVYRGLEVVEFAASIGNLLLGSNMPNVARGVDCYSLRQPLGVTAGICPFNFPAMVPLWMFPIAAASGNTMVLKPSERTPGAAMILARLAAEAGLPPGVLNIVHGAHGAVNQICDDPTIQAVGFVGSSTAGEYIYQRASARGKRVQANMGAKNHAVLMPDADKDATCEAIVGAAFGAVGQRCMAISAAVCVGDAAEWAARIAERASLLVVGSGMDPRSDLGPVISPEALERMRCGIDQAQQEGAHIVCDGRNVTVSQSEKGNFIGPTVLLGVTTSMACYQEELFGPILCIVEAESLEHAISIVNDSRYGNGCAIFTRSGWRGSFCGDLNMMGTDAVRFFTRTKTVTARWNVRDGGSKVSSLHRVGAS